MGGRGYASKRFESSSGDSSGGLGLGKHFGNVKIKGQVARANELRDVLRQVDDPGLLRWMEKNPLREIVFASRTSAGGNGSYNAKRFRLQLAADRDESKLGKTFVPGKTFSFAQLATTKNAAIASTLYHEIGHHAMYELRGEAYANVKKTFDSLGGKTATKYGRMNASEHFSESFAAYFQHPQKLKSASPKAYAMVDRAVKSLGIR
jgi:hypothetical protein